MNDSPESPNNLSENKLPSDSGSLSREATVKIDPNHDIFYNAFTTPEFQARITAAIKRLQRLRAESGFSILTNGQELLYTPLQLGGAHPDNFQDVRVGMSARTGTGISEISDDWLLKHAPEDYPLLADFHSHPSGRAFSQDDMEVYDNPLPKVALNYDFGRRIDVFHGVLIPIYEGKSITMAQLMMYQGPPTSNEYQAADFRSINSATKQKEVLEQSGLRVILTNLQVEKGSVDFSGIAAQLSNKPASNRLEQTNLHL